MKYANKYISYLIWLAIIVFIFNAQGFVHCQSEDGHTSLEPIFNKCCDRADVSTTLRNNADSSSKTFFTKRDNCGPCVDTVFSFDVVNTDKKIVSLNSAIAAVPAILFITDAYYGYSGHAFRSEFPASVNPSLPSIRTVILLA